MPNKHRYLTCHKCGKTMRCDHIQRHMNVCTKDGNLGAGKVQIQQPIKKARNHGTLGTIFPEKREKPVDSVHSKTLNPKISALVDAIVNEEDQKIRMIRKHQKILMIAVMTMTPELSQWI